MASLLAKTNVPLVSTGRLKHEQPLDRGWWRGPIELRRFQPASGFPQTVRPDANWLDDLAGRALRHQMQPCRPAGQNRTAGAAPEVGTLNYAAAGSTYSSIKLIRRNFQGTAGNGRRRQTIGLNCCGMPSPAKTRRPAGDFVAADTDIAKSKRSRGTEPNRNDHPIPETRRQTMLPP